MTYKTIVCLVGENPLPIYLGIRHYARAGTQIVLIQTGSPTGTREQANSIARKVIYNKMADGVPAEIAHSLVKIHPNISAYSAPDIMRAVREYTSAGESLLNYTGGTKIMASFGVLGWYNGKVDNTGLPVVEDAVYLEEESGSFRKSDGKLERLVIDPPLTLAEVVEIHKPDFHSHNENPKYTEADLKTLFRLRSTYYSDDKDDDKQQSAFRAICNLRCNDGDEYNVISRSFVAQSGEIKQGSAWHKFITEVLSDETQRDWMASKLPANRDAYSDFRNPKKIVESPLAAQVGFARGKWLEHYVAAMLLALDESGKFTFGHHPACPIFDKSNLLNGQQFLIGNKLFEADVVGLYENRIRYVSVTTSRVRGEVKSKLFEAMHRAKQIGGGLARSCVVCPLNSKVCDNLWLSTGGDNDHQIFGWGEMEKWERGYVSHQFLQWLTK